MYQSFIVDARLSENLSDIKSKVIQYALKKVSAPSREELGGFEVVLTRPEKMTLGGEKRLGDVLSQRQREDTSDAYRYEAKILTQGPGGAGVAVNMRLGFDNFDADPVLIMRFAVSMCELDIAHDLPSGTMMLLAHEDALRRREIAAIDAYEDTLTDLQCAEHVEKLVTDELERGALESYEDALSEVQGAEHVEKLATDEVEGDALERYEEALVNASDCWWTPSSGVSEEAYWANQDNEPPAPGEEEYFEKLFRDYYNEEEERLRFTWKPSLPDGMTTFQVLGEQFETLKNVGVEVLNISRFALRLECCGKREQCLEAVEAFRASTALAA